MREAARVLESYLLRRTVCVSDTEAYNPAAFSCRA